MASTVLAAVRDSEPERAASHARNGTRMSRCPCTHTGCRLSRLTPRRRADLCARLKTLRWVACSLNLNEDDNPARTRHASMGCALLLKERQQSRHDVGVGSGGIAQERPQLLQRQFWRRCERLETRVTPIGCAEHGEPHFDAPGEPECDQLLQELVGWRPTENAASPPIAANARNGWPVVLQCPHATCPVLCAACRASMWHVARHVSMSCGCCM